MKRRIISTLLLVCMLLGSVACSSGSETTESTTKAASAETQTAAETEKQYDYQSKNYDGYTFTFLNFEALWNTHLRIVPDELTGEALNDALFDRNKKIEEALNQTK